MSFADQGSAGKPGDGGLAEGEQRRDQAHHLLHVHRPILIRRVQRCFLRWLLDHGPSTSDPVRNLVPIPDGIDPRLVGAGVRALAAERLIESVGRQKSQRPEAHARQIDVWAITDRAAAVQWLAAHPGLPAPGEPTLFPEP